MRATTEQISKSTPYPSGAPRPNVFRDPPENGPEKKMDKNGPKTVVNLVTLSVRVINAELVTLDDERYPCSPPTPHPDRVVIIRYLVWPWQ